MCISQLIIAVLAVWEIVEIWHHSHLLAYWRAVTECWEGWCGQLLRCPFCLSPWIALPVILVLTESRELDVAGHRQLGLLLAAPLYAFAVARAANLANDLGHRHCRTPGSNRKKTDDGEEAP